ncbi:MAG: hypothetical protein ACX94B_05030 [Henriciella sp.]
MIVDGYKDSNGYLDYDIFYEIDHMCGEERRIITAFATNATCKAEDLGKQYWALRKPKDAKYNWLNTVRGSAAMKEVFKDASVGDDSGDKFVDLCN